jgi:hypothetical protein
MRRLWDLKMSKHSYKGLKALRLVGEMRMSMGMKMMRRRYSRI